MLYQYHCACCNKVVSSTDKECPHCGSHHIRSPYGLWMFCIVACFAAVLLIKGMHAYIQNQQQVDDIPTQSTTIFDVLKQKHD